jgi:hypothetical protein
MLDTGVKNVRLMIPWAGAEPVQNQFDWTNVDRTVNAAVARNMAVIGIINASPVWAQAPTTSTLFETPTGIITSPTPVADKARQFGGYPKTEFQNGYQDFESPTGMRVWWSPATGAHAVGGGFVAAWVPGLGLALTDEFREGWATKVTFT